MDYLRRVGKYNKQLLYPWLDATEYPKIVQLDILVEDEEIPAYIERLLKDGHKWKEEKDVLASIDEIEGSAEDNRLEFFVLMFVVLYNSLTDD
jgi:hypothetical protein